MNLFDILSAGKRDLNEENVSSFLAWILDPKQSHGCGQLFLDRLLALMGKEAEQLTVADVLVEEKVITKEGKERTIDILLNLNKGDKAIVLAIENKIREGSYDEFQLIEEYEGLTNSAESTYSEIYFLYLTPSKSGKFNNAFSKLPEDSTKIHLTWKDCIEESVSSSIVAMLRGILEDDLKAVINPLSSELKFVLKSFIVFAESEFRSRGNKKFGPNLGKINPYYKDRVTGIEEVRKLREHETGEIYIGFLGGINALNKGLIEKLENRPYKWLDSEMFKVTKNQANWLPFDQFMEIIDKKYLEK
jgi:hypothetical protein